MNKKTKMRRKIVGNCRDASRSFPRPLLSVPLQTVTLKLVLKGYFSRIVKINLPLYWRIGHKMHLPEVSRHSQRPLRAPLGVPFSSRSYRVMLPFETPTISRGQKLNTDFFSNFSGNSGISQQNSRDIRPKSFSLGFEGHANPIVFLFAWMVGEKPEGIPYRRCHREEDCIKRPAGCLLVSRLPTFMNMVSQTAKILTREYWMHERDVPADMKKPYESSRMGDCPMTCPRSSRMLETPANSC